MAYASIVFGAVGLLLLATSIGLGSGTLGYVSLAAAIVGAILGAMSRATKQGKAGLILSLVSLFLVALSIASLVMFAPSQVTISTTDSSPATAAPR